MANSANANLAMLTPFAEGDDAINRRVNEMLGSLILEEGDREGRYLILTAAFVIAVKELGGNAGLLIAGFDDSPAAPLEDAQRETIRMANARGQALLAGVRHIGDLYAICGVLMVFAHIQYMAIGGTTPEGHKELLDEMVDAMRTVPSPTMTVH